MGNGGAKELGGTRFELADEDLTDASQNGTITDENENAGGENDGREAQESVVERDTGDRGSDKKIRKRIHDGRISQILKKYRPKTQRNGGENSVRGSSEISSDLNEILEIFGYTEDKTGRVENTNTEVPFREFSEEYAQKGKVSGGDLEIIWMLSDTVKNFKKIEILDEEGESKDGYSSYDDEMSQARGRRRAKRDRMGRYSSEGYSSEDDFEDGESSYRRSYESYDGGSMSNRSSLDGAREHMIKKLGKMMENANPEERELIKGCMRNLEKE